MEKMNLRKGLFGYTESSVVAYIEAINSEMKARIQKLTEENDGLKERCELYESEKNSANDKQDALLEKINLLSKEKEDMQTEIAGLTEKISDLNTRLNEATADKFDYAQGQSELADIMLEAKRFEKELEARTEYEYAQKKAQNDEKIHSECKRIERFISDIDEVCGVLRKAYNNLGEEVEKQKSELSVVLNNLKVLEIKQG